jgi:hypothetical protein
MKHPQIVQIAVEERRRPFLRAAQKRHRPCPGAPERRFAERRSASAFPSAPAVKRPARARDPPFRTQSLQIAKEPHCSIDLAHWTTACDDHVVG